MYVTYSDLIQIGIFIVAREKKIAATTAIVTAVTM